MKTTMTSDFTGTYDYPEVEAKEIAAGFLDYISDHNNDEMIAIVAKERAYWLRIFGDDEQGRADMARFIEVFNSEFGKKYNLPM